MYIIGDVHGKFDEYFNVIAEMKKSVQIGDFGFDYPDMTDYPNHRFFKGNHDNYDVSHPNDLGDFGVHEDMFFVRGAETIDKNGRTQGVNYWDNEQLNWSQANAMLALYDQVRPDIVLSHDAPQFLIHRLYRYAPSYTRVMLDEMWKIHQPKFWIYGHHHVNTEDVISGTRFICLNELCYTLI